MAQKTIFDLDLLAIARARQHLSLATTALVIVLIIWIIGLVNGVNQPDLIFVAGNTLMGLLGIWVVVAGILLQIKMGVGVLLIVLTAIVAIAVPWLAGPALISQATTILKLAGAKPGFVGVPKSELDKITPGHCRGCGYAREGIGLLDPCPECTRVPRVI